MNTEHFLCFRLRQLLGVRRFRRYDLLESESKGFRHRPGERVKGLIFLFLGVTSLVS